MREHIGGAAQTTLRGQVGTLRDIGALQRQVRSEMPYTVENELTDLGCAVIDVADTVEAWLSRAPQGPIALGSEAAKGAIRSLVAGWDSTMLRALAIRPLSLTELDGAIPEINYPSLDRRLSAMRAARQVEALPADSQAKPYAVTEWTRQAVAPLVAAWRCEREHLADDTEPITKIDIEAAFLLAVPLVQLPPSASGSLLLAVSGGSDGEPAERLAGVDVAVEHGEVAPLDSGREREPETWATGPVDSWVTAILDGRLDGLRLSGDAELARALVEGMHLSFK